MSWSQIGSDLLGEAAGDRFGWFLDLSSNGTIVAVGAYGNDDGGNNSGHVRVYEWDGTTWNQKGSDIDGASAGHRFGTSVNLSSDGTIIAIGAFSSNTTNGTDSGHVEVYEWDSGSSDWSQKGSNIDGAATGDWSGRITSLSSDGTILAIGSNKHDSQKGHVRVFEWDSGSSVWSQKGSDIDGAEEGDNCGYFIDLSSDGTILAISSTGHSSSKGHVRVYEWDSGSSDWSQKGSDIDGAEEGDTFGYSLSLNNDGTILAIGGDRHDNEKGHVQVYEWDSGSSSWSQKGSDIDGDDDYDRLGVCVDLNNDGTILAIGINNSDENADSCGSAKIYEWDGTAWSQKGSEIHGDDEDDRFGKSVSLNGDGTILAIGSHPLNTTINGYTRVYEYTSSSVPCFCAGTLIKTPTGYTPVEELKEEDEILSTENKVLNVKYNAKYLALGSHSMPIKINQNAFGVNKPNQDLYVSPNHRIKTSDGIKKAIELVNGETITQRNDINKVIYYDLYSETLGHLIYANNLEVGVDYFNLASIANYRKQEVDAKQIEFKYKINVADVLKLLRKQKLSN